MSEFPTGQLRVNLHVSGTIDFVPAGEPPTKGTIEAVTFQREGDQMTGTVQLSPTLPEDHVTNRMVVVTVANKRLPVTDALTKPAQFKCNEGDDILVTNKDVNAAGSTDFDPFETVAELPLEAPTKGQILGVVFSA